MVSSKKQLNPHYLNSTGFLRFLALTLCSPLDGMASNIFIIIIDTTWRGKITQIVSGSISFTYNLIPRGRQNHLKIALCLLLPMALLHCLSATLNSVVVGDPRQPRLRQDQLPAARPQARLRHHQGNADHVLHPGQPGLHSG